MPELASRVPVRVEPLESFLGAEPAGLAQVLREEEAWARAHVPTYPSRPEALAFRAEAAPAPELFARFLAAVRVNPASRLAFVFNCRSGGRPGIGRRWPRPM